LDSPIQDEQTLNQAYCDLIYLLDRKYPKKSALTFVANHYTLDKKQRNILNRAALPSNIVKVIKNNLVKDYDLIKGKELHIDAYNQITTFYSLKNNDPVIICRDGFLRDIFSSLHTKRDLQIDRELLIPYFESVKKLNPKSVHFYFDKQISFSLEHVKLAYALFQEFDLLGSCETYESVDWYLKKQTEEIVLSHDSTILTVAPHCFDFFSWFLKMMSPSTLSQRIIVDFLNITCSNT
jgi:hypothetical protein